MLPLLYNYFNALTPLAICRTGAADRTPLHHQPHEQRNVLLSGWRIKLTYDSTLRTVFKAI